MELLSIILSGLLTLVSPVGVVFDNIAERDIRSALHSAEELEVRLDNSPNYFLFAGKVERLRFAGRGLYLTPDIRIESFEVETDPIEVDLDRLNEEDESGVPLFLQEPLQGAFRLVLTEEDMNRALRSAPFIEELGEAGIGAIPETEDETIAQRFRIVNPEVDFLGNNRIRVQVEIQDLRDEEQVTIAVETGLEVVGGTQLRAIDTQITINGEEAPSRLENLVVNLVERVFNLKKFEENGLLARFLDFTITGERLELTAFARVEDPEWFYEPRE
ncbi:LmeA family phospholipid-binding protein [Phormidium sp. CCY1219]|uniref:LmeA family phospholipid-binding protein n=1 Tax=Phormidium sp. CCY1219 TaxID=2886104 RepID=UPI002D1F5766|nr:DUF2993 domain-containing protein [Phormidium sp. CCY1219]MEB3829674.1 DUF2993 domain-containing protein [Phormidium sp. CCY1219]